MKTSKQDFISMYGGAKMVFCSYYKYTFTFKGVLPSGDDIWCSVGGDSDDIYRLEVTLDPTPLESLDPDRAWVRRDGNTTDEY